MYRNVLFILSIFFIFQSFQSKGQDYFWVSFTDKNNTEYSINKPEEFLSDRSIQRRIKQNIPIDSLDLPINANYIDSILSIGVELVHGSKWLNGITVKGEVADFQNEVQKISFVDEVQLSKPAQTTKSAFNKFYETSSEDTVPIDTSMYGESMRQTALLNGQFLHQNYNGEGIQIAVLDAGFYKADEYASFDSLWTNDQILGVKDFVDPDSDIFTTSSHGMSVLSTMGGNVPGELIGTARKASYWLLRSEDMATEYIIEEDNWIAAAEFADSVGVDIINSSLGYYKFDDPETDHSYSDMDGRTTRVTRGANIAASRGILVFSSAGNEGEKAWKYIIAPSDGVNVIGVGATFRFGHAAYFTSFGPASDGAIKPNIAAMGVDTWLQLSNGDLGPANGTSFSSPVMAGMAACLWQANPNATAVDIKNALEQSASQYSNPDSLLGYGVPDMKLADLILEPLISTITKKKKEWSIYPNPIGDYLVLQKTESNSLEEIFVEIYSSDGRLLRNWKKYGSQKIVLSGLQRLPAGLLVLKINSSASSQAIKLYKHR
jgi:serine protease AprX